MIADKFRFAYAPLSKDFSQPGDKWRFCSYASRRGISYEIADPAKNYSVVVLSQGADLSQWHSFPKNKGKVIFDFVDSYLAIPEWEVRSIVRGPAKFFFRQNRYLHLNYRKLLEAMCRRADAVICATEEQKLDILPFCKNVHIILDFHTTVVQKIKTDYSRGEVFNFVWEGFPNNLVTFRGIMEALKQLKNRHKFAIHIITNLERPLGLREFFRIPTMGLVRDVFDLEDVFLYEWNEKMFSTICTTCDLALIPIPLDNPIYVGKPENKLLLFWRMGIPVITSATPAYSRAMDGCGLPMTCRSQEEWIATLEHYMEDEGARREAGKRGLAYANEYYGEEALLKRWDALFGTLL